MATKLFQNYINKSKHVKIMVNLYHNSLMVNQNRLLSSTNNASNIKNDTKITSNDDNNNNSIRKSVFISQSYDIFTNLALEDWIYKNYDFTNHHVLMLWMNNPCVVIGRHQNPFSEADISQLETNGIELARRNSNDLFFNNT